MKILHTHILIIVLSIFAVTVHAQSRTVDTSGFKELTPGEFLELTAGRSFKGIHRRLEYVQSHHEDKRKFVDGIYNGEPYSGRWTEGENNCTIIIFDFSELPNCWKLLHKNGEYVYAYYNLNGTKLIMSHYVTFLD